jgi:hypothetical protein
MSIYKSPNFIYYNSQDCITEIQERIASVFNTSTSSNLSISSGLQITNPNNLYYVKVAEGGLDTNNPDGITINSAPTHTTACNFNGDINMNSYKISSILSQKFSQGIEITDYTTDAEISSNGSGLLSLSCSNNLTLNVNNNSIVELTPAALTLIGTNGIIIDTTSMNFSNGINISDEDYSLYTSGGGFLTVLSNNLQNVPITHFNISDLIYSNSISSRYIQLPILETVPSITLTSPGTICFAIDINNEIHFYANIGTGSWVQIA